MGVRQLRLCCRCWCLRRLRLELGGVPREQVWQVHQWICRWTNYQSLYIKLGILSTHLSCPNFAISGLCSSGKTVSGGSRLSTLCSNISRNLTVSRKDCRYKRDCSLACQRTLHCLWELVEGDRFLLEYDLSILKLDDRSFFWVDNALISAIKRLETRRWR